MKNIARQALLFITSHQEIKKILKHIGEETRRAPHSLLSLMDRRTLMTLQGISRQMRLIFMMKNGALKPQGALCLKSGFFKPA